MYSPILFKNERLVIRTCIIIALFALLPLTSAEGSFSSSSATTNSVTLNWTAPGDDADTGMATQYDIRYSLANITATNFDSALQASGIPVPSPAGSADTYTVTGLQPGTLYYFAIKTADEASNWSLISNVVALSTSQETIPPQDVADLLAASPTPNSLLLSWTAPGDDGNVGTASQYDIRYADFPITASNWDSTVNVSGEPTPSVAGSSESMVVSGLSVNTTYYFAMKTSDDVPNWSGLSNVTSAATLLEQTPPENIVSLATSNQTDTSISLSWTSPGDDSSSGTAAQYDIRYSVALITASNWDSASQAAGEPVPAIAGSQETFVIGGLLSNTIYYFAIKTADEVPNWSGLSNVAIDSTNIELTAPAVITNLVTSNPTASSIDLTWTASGDDGNVGTASQYDIRYSTAIITTANFDSASQVSGAPSPSAAGNQDSMTVGGLQTNTIYYFAIKVSDEVPNWSGMSVVVIRSTTPDVTPPAAIDDLGASPGQSNGEIEISWTAPSDDGIFGKAEFYEVKLALDSLGSNGWDTVASIGFNFPPANAGVTEIYTVPGLEPGRIYFAAIRSIDYSGNVSAYSNTASSAAYVDLLVDVEDQNQPLPSVYDLGQNYPNPFNPTTTIEYSVAEAGHINLSVYDVAGRRTAVLVDEMKSPGYYQIDWDTAGGGSQVASGIYFYRLTTSSYSETKKMALLK